MKRDHYSEPWRQAEPIFWKKMFCSLGYNSSKNSSNTILAWNVWFYCNNDKDNKPHKIALGQNRRDCIGEQAHFQCIYIQELVMNTVLRFRSITLKFDWNYFESTWSLNSLPLYLLWKDTRKYWCRTMDQKCLTKP